MTKFERLRLKAGLNRSQLAALSGVNRNTIKAIECGSVNVTTTTLQRLSKALRVDIEVLINVDRIKIKING